MTLSAIWNGARHKDAAHVGRPLPCRISSNMFFWPLQDKDIMMDCQEGQSSAGDYSGASWLDPDFIDFQLNSD